jgi:hypothetical protein
LYEKFTTFLCGTKFSTFRWPKAAVEGHTFAMGQTNNIVFDGLQRILEYPLLKPGNTQFTFATLVKILFWLALVPVANWLLRRFIMQRLLKRTHFDSSLQYAIEKKLRENKIEVPFPQRDLHLRSGNFVLQTPPPADH